MRVYLIGFMGCGKTTFGKKLARKMNVDFIDLDKQIEAHEGKSVSEVFAEKGEAYFRELESSLLQQTISLNHAVISCGGGTPCFHDNMHWMREHGITVYLKVTPEFLFSRLHTRREKRPLIAKLNDEELQAYITTKLEEREEYYQQAQQVIDPVHAKPGFVADLLNARKGN